MNGKAHSFVLFHLAATGISLSVALGIKAAVAQSYTLTTLATLNATSGVGPHGGITLDSSGNLYGTTGSGGTNNDGTVFKIAAGTSTLTTIANFSGATNGDDPIAGVTFDSSGDLYGTTYAGGANNFGTVFKLTPSGSASAPEPAALALLLSALAPLDFARRSLRNGGCRPAS